MLNEQIIDDIKKLIEGDVSVSVEDLETYARDTSLFYVKPQRCDEYRKGRRVINCLFVDFAIFCDHSG